MKSVSNMQESSKPYGSTVSASYLGRVTHQDPSNWSRDSDREIDGAAMIKLASRFGGLTSGQMSASSLNTPRYLTYLRYHYLVDQYLLQGLCDALRD